MDPEILLRLAEEAVREKHWREAEEHLVNYRVWRINKGLEPENGDARAQAVREVLARRGKKR